jgi:hypothetical protein
VFEAAISDIPQVYTFQANQYEYKKLHGDEWTKKSPRRQHAACKHARSLTRADWLCHIDIDEFLIPDIPFEDFLGSLPGEIVSVHINNAERVFNTSKTYGNILSGVYRIPIRKLQTTCIDMVYGCIGEYLGLGLSGHTKGKAFTRVSSANTWIAVHETRALNASDLSSVTVQYPGVGMVHFDVMTLNHWTAKMLSRLERDPGARIAIQEGKSYLKGMKKGRRKIIGDIILADGDHQKIAQIYDAITTLKPEQSKTLDDAGLLFKTNLDFTAALPKYFPKNSEGLTISGFDRQFQELMERDAALHYLRNSNECG